MEVEVIRPPPTCYYSCCCYSPRPCRPPPARPSPYSCWSRPRSPRRTYLGLPWLRRHCPAMSPSSRRRRCSKTASCSLLADHHHHPCPAKDPMTMGTCCCCRNVAPAELAWTTNARTCWDAARHWPRQGYCWALTTTVVRWAAAKRRSGGRWSWAGMECWGREAPLSRRRPRRWRRKRSCWRAAWMWPRRRWWRPWRWRRRGAGGCAYPRTSSPGSTCPLGIVAPANRARTPSRISNHHSMHRCMHTHI